MGLRALAIVLVISNVLMTGCRILLESSLEFAKESRPPKWMVIPPGLTRANVSITMNYYGPPLGNNTQFVLKDDHGKTLKTINGQMKCWDPIRLKNPQPGSPENYPRFEAITVERVTEMIEHKKPEPFSYVADNAAVWKQYLATGCN